MAPGQPFNDLPTAQPEPAGEAGIIHRTLQDSAGYVARFLDEARARRALQVPLRYAQGEKHLLLGRRYPLDISVRPDERRRIAWLSDRIRVIVPERPDAETVRIVLLDGYRRLALDEFAARLQAVSEQAAWTRRRPPPLRVRRMKASWGTCSVDGLITLNPLLLRAPSRCVDYVIVHEVCHLREHNHSARFYALQEQLFPAWRQAKQHLFDRGHLYLQL